MARPNTKPTTKPGQGAVLVSRNLQLLVVITFVAISVLQLITLIPTYLTSTIGFRGDYAAGIIVMSAFPLLLFAATYLLSPKYPSVLHRAFIAVIKTVAISTIAGLLVGIKNYYPLLFSSQYAGDVTPPSWVTSFAIDYTVYAIALIATIVISYLRYLHKK